MVWLSAILISLFSSYYSKFEVFTGFLSFFLFGISMGMPNYLTNGDANVYEQNYEMQSNEFEAGYNFISHLFDSAYSYPSFRMITSIFFCLALCFGIFFMTKKLSTFALLYGICAFPFDTLQVRSSIAFVFIVFGILFLYKFGKKGIFPSIIIIYVGSLFHSTSLIYLIIPIGYLFVDNILKHKRAFFTGLIIIIIILTVFATTHIGNMIIQLVSKYSTRTDAAMNIANIYNSGSSFVSIMMVAIFTIFLAAFLFDKRNKSNFSPLYEVAVLAFIVWLIGFVLFTLSVDYIRLLRITTLIIFIYFCYLLSIKVPKISLLNYSLLFSILLFLIQMKIYGLSLNTILSDLSLL